MKGYKRRDVGEQHTTGLCVYVCVGPVDALVKNKVLPSERYSTLELESRLSFFPSSLST